MDEKKAVDSVLAREIVQEIINFGVSQHQLLKVIKLAALELENRDAMCDITNIVNKYLGTVDVKPKSGLIT